jgi:site-specific recombinase XerC
MQSLQPGVTVAESDMDRKRIFPFWACSSAWLEHWSYKAFSLKKENLGKRISQRKINERAEEHQVSGVQILSGPLPVCSQA